MKHPVYVHPLDYVTGIKYCLTGMRLEAEYTPGPENFFVEEIIDWRRLGFSRSGGGYIVYMAVKRGIDTFRMIDCFSWDLGIPKSNIVFLGLKDRDATSRQYLFIKRSIVRNPPIEITGARYSARLIGYVQRKPSKTHLLGNRFKVIVDGSDKIYATAKEIMSVIHVMGLPSYYGYQRFGARRPNTHLLGKYIVENRLDLFLEELLNRVYPGEHLESLMMRLRKKFTRRLFFEYQFIKEGVLELSGVLRRDRRLFMLLVDAYQSYLYNLLLSRIIEVDGWNGLNREYPVPACRSSRLYAEYLGVDTSPIARAGARCWWRKGIFYPRNIYVGRRNGAVILGFTLDRGMYASIVLRELFKDNLLF